MLANFSDKELTVIMTTTLGIAQEVQENLLVTLKEEKEGNSNSEYPLEFRRIKNPKASMSEILRREVISPKSFRESRDRTSSIAIL
jgi:predicted CopG family antitoxin